MRRIRTLILVVFTCFVCTAWSQAQQQSITTFDVPGAGTGSGQGTTPEFMNPSGVIVGQYIDAGGATHGFLRAKDGTITTFDAPGAGTGPGEGTSPWSINPAGVVTGWYTDDAGLTHGFVRASDGAFSSFDAPGAGIPAGVPCTPPIICSNGTQGAAINPAGVISGQYVDTGGVFHGFLRTKDGAIITFDAPGAGTNSGQGTFVVFGDGINSSGTILGAYADASNNIHGMVRSLDGVITPFDVTGSVFLDPAGINPEGAIIGFYAEASGPTHGFLRNKDGAITSFDYSGAGTGSGQGTLPFNINTPGDSVGTYIDVGGVNHGFLRTKDGAIISFDVPGSQGTFPVCNNPSNAITGFYIDASGVHHGFLRE
jgi:predicted membrane protein